MPYKSPFQANKPASAQHHEDSPHSDVVEAYIHNAAMPRVNADVYMFHAISASYPGLEVLDTDVQEVNVLAYILQTGDGAISTLTENDSLRDEKDCSTVPSSHFKNHNSDSQPISSLMWTNYIPPVRRIGVGSGSVAVEHKYGKYLVNWQNHEFLIYIIETSQGDYPVYNLKRQYIVTSDRSAAYSLLKTVGLYSNVLHGEIWVFDQGFWQKDPDLFRSIQKSRWEDIILPASLKEDLIQTIQRFYDSSEIYQRLHVPWKRGLIFYGPPGNGKTVSIKATMKTLYDRKDSIPTMYVKSFASFGGPEYSISQIFAKARQQAPCYLVIEDLDSIVTDDVRSFFLNAVDGLASNDGILMIGSTNHLDRLDPGIAKRPSRFDRKYLFPNPDLTQRIAYCKFWQKKLKDNKDVEFPDELLRPIASLTDEFSFAYIQEAFVSTLLKIANDSESHSEFVDLKPSTALELDDLEAEIIIIEKEDLGYSLNLDKGGNPDDKLDGYLLWREIKVQIANLRKELDKGQD